MSTPDEMLIFGGSGSPRLAQKICDYLGVPPGQGEVLRFSEGNLFVRICEPVRGRRACGKLSTAPRGKRYPHPNPRPPGEGEV